MARVYPKLDAAARQSLDNKIAVIVVGAEFSQSVLKFILLTEENVAEVVETASFDEALEKLAKRKDVGLAILDLPLPGVEAEKIAILRKRSPVTRVVVVSDSTERTDVLAALEKGAHGYIPKRLGIAEFRNALAMVFDRLIYVPSSISDLQPAQHRSSVNVPPSAITHLPARREHSAGEQLSVQPTLTPRQLHVLELLIQGKSNKEICRGLNLRQGTVKIHVAGIFRALHVSSRTCAAVVGANLLTSTAPALKQHGYVPGARRPQRSHSMLHALRQAS